MKVSLAKFVLFWLATDVRWGLGGEKFYKLCQDLQDIADGQSRGLYNYFKVGLNSYFPVPHPEGLRDFYIWTVCVLVTHFEPSDWLIRFMKVISLDPSLGSHFYHNF